MLFIALSTSSLQAQFIKNKIDTLKYKREVKISQTEKYKIFGTSVSLANIQDTKMTPLVYFGTGIGFNGDVFKTVNKFTHFTSFNAHYIAFMGPDGTSSIMHGTKLRFNKGILCNLDSKFNIGGSTNAEFNGRIYPKNGNDMLNVEILATVNLAASYVHKFDLFNRERTLDFRAELPLFAYAMRYPDYNVFGITNLFMPIGKYKALRTKFTLVNPYKHSKENKYSISYEWDLYMFKENDNFQKLVSGTHLITFSYWLKKI